MRFRSFRRRPKQDPPSEVPGEEPADTTPHEWFDSGVAEEVEAFLEGRFVDYLVARGRSVPAWASLNRLAHLDHAGVVELVAGSGSDRSLHPGRRLHAWAEHERFLAARLLASCGGTPDGLVRLQRDAIVPVELSLISRWWIESQGPDEVLDAAADALDSYRTGA